METDAIEPQSPVPGRVQQPSRGACIPEVSAPVISVIVPVRNSPRELRLCLQCLATSTYSLYEVIVVDDASTDKTTEVAAELGALVLQLGTRRGSAGARNRGAEYARGEYLLFIDADVCVRPDTLQKLHDTFENDPDLDAVFGSYDTEPSAINVLSQYKNLFHHFVHQDSREQATTFWSGCGAVRRSVFLKMGGFSVRYKRPSIEDIELGARLHKAGHRIMLNKRIQVTHLKRWTVWSIFKTDLLDRGIPWTELMLREGNIPNDLNVKVSQRISVVLAYGLLIFFGIGVWYYRQLVWLPLILLMFITAFDYWSVHYRFATAVRLLTAFAGLGILAIIGTAFGTLPLLPLALVVGIVAINFRFYVFFLNRGSRLMLMLLLPMHLLYYLYCGLAFAGGVVLHLWKAPVTVPHETESLGSEDTELRPERAPHANDPILDGD